MIMGDRLEERLEEQGWVLDHLSECGQGHTEEIMSHPNYPGCAIYRTCCGIYHRGIIVNNCYIWTN